MCNYVLVVNGACRAEVANRWTAWSSAREPIIGWVVDPRTVGLQGYESPPSARTHVAEIS